MSSLLSTYIPAAGMAAVETALQQVCGTTDVTEITPLSGGLSTASVYKIVVHNQAYVLKTDTPSETATLSENLTLAAAAGIAPPLFYHNAATGVSVSGFIVPQPVRTTFAPDVLVTELAKTIQIIHAIPGNKAGADLKETIDGLIAGFKQCNILYGPVVEECFTYYEQVRNKYPWQDSDRVFSHNDLNPNNILCDGKKIWIIDWDAAYLNDRYIDLANTANFFVHTAAQEQLFLDTYFGQAVSEYQKARFYIMQQVCRIIYAMLMFQMAAGRKPADYAHDQQLEGVTLQQFIALMSSGKLALDSYEGQFIYGKALLNEALTQMRTPRFEAALLSYKL